MPTIVENQQANAETFASAIGRQSQVVGTLEELKRRLDSDPDEFAIILGPAVDLEAAAALADTLRVTRPALSVILIRRRLDTSVLAEALRSGMREVVEERDLTGLGTAVQRAVLLREAMLGQTGGESGRGGKQITVFSPKGGVGKTTVAVNLAVALANGGSRRVCLVDLDLAFGDVAITLQLFPARTIYDAVPMQSGLEIELLETLLTSYQGKLSILAAPVQPDAKDLVPAPLIARLLRLLKANYDYVVVDTAPSFDEQVLQAIDDSDELLVVTTLDVPTLKNVKIASETLDLLNFPVERRRLVLNRADEQVGLSVTEVESTLGMKVMASIPASPQVANATNTGAPIVAGSPRHPASKAIISLASSLTAASSAPHPRGKRAATPKRGFIRRGSRA